ncbi:ELAV-like protein 1 isoform X1 [Mercenaria mercenaria]|uniref:ELAV-like protein 1 isoform X1 n=1 Tax=Mercenaria mercenaria TaxID=6596 RepID=UPI00234EC6F0|nr:ELAV-like protein 1 isoform X1 [Mercenaria mercenaria]XP_053381528.1 ELAV-like protein 1 isoform X1 [Mercenaria mercenaria]XP_053381529.1 ELAV-like protein 1 isoform X1 [Mercenaria mercenaria]XP_053381530.1 ELAV-like protein 1 isoform X1 [Mercenaria mercenaria]XP_053381531.1 ELAV-like protein 1 isoform X1 [Mercenaria mercenaria]
MSTENINNNLIINYLPQFITDEEYKNMFLSIGPIKSSKIVRDKSTGFSYGFGFVEYHTDRDAARAVKVFDGLPMYGKRIRVQHANKNEEQPKAFNIYVKNIPSTFTETDLDRLFDPFGKIVTSKVLMDLQTGQSRNVGFVLYETKEEADKAIAEMNGKTVPGATSALYVKYADDATKKATKVVQPVIPQVLTQPPPFPPPVPQGNGFPTPSQPGPVRNQPINRNRFNPMARTNTTTNDYPVPNFNVNQNFNANNQNTGFFGMNNPQNSGVTSPNVDVPKGPGPYSLFVFNIGDDAEERELWALFSPFGTVQKCTVMMDNERRVCKGYGFVDMANAMEAANAIKSLNGFFYKGKQLNVSFKHKKQ